MLEDRNFSKEDRDVLRSQTLEEYLKGTPAARHMILSQTIRSIHPNFPIIRIRVMG